MDADTDRIDEAVLALMHLGIHYNDRAWKEFDRDTMSRLHEKGFIDFPFGKAKSITLTKDGLRQSEELFTKLFVHKTLPTFFADKEFVALLAKTLVCFAFRNTDLEDLHSGTSPSSKAGDFSDVKVVTPYGEIPWVRTDENGGKKLARFDNDEMCALMQEAVNKVFTILLRLDNLDQLVHMMEDANIRTSKWDPPEELADWSTGTLDDKKIQKLKESGQII